MAKTTDPTGNTGLTVNLLPNFYRTPANSKFLQATLDQLYQPGAIKKINGYVGKRNAKSAKATDIFLSAPDLNRQNYQLEPGMVVQDALGNTTFFKDYIDYINCVGSLGGNTSNHARISKQEFYSWDPHISWDKFVNFQNYYWMPYGPETINIYGQLAAITSTYTVSVEKELSNNEYLFTPNGLTRNPALKLYRGQTYTFEIASPGNPFSIKTARSLGTQDRYEISSIDNYGVTSGSITFTIPADAPDMLFYQSETDLNLGGVIEVYNITADTYIDVANELIGKKQYKLADGTDLSNGMKLKFGGNVTPAEYALSEFYVEGVGVAIKLVSALVLEVTNHYTIEQTVPFDSDKFDSLPFSDATGFAGKKDYIVINRGSNDRNTWSRYNRWFHKDVIDASARYNNVIASLDQVGRAVRPIIEFDADLKLFNYGTNAVPDVDLIDTFTDDAFSIIEGSFGYNIDGVALTQGQRILFTADTDILVNNKIYQVEFLDFQHLNGGSRQIHLVEVSVPQLSQIVLVKRGKLNQGNSFWYNGSAWVLAQEKLTVNQAPLFDMVDSNKISYSDTDVYNGSTFTGTTLFSYKSGTGSPDPVLEFPLSYMNINNIGDIVFNFNLATDTFQYKSGTSLITVNVSAGFLISQNAVGSPVYKNGWQICNTATTQAAVRIYNNTNSTNFIGTGYIVNNTFIVTSNTAGTIFAGMLLQGTGIASDTYITGGSGTVWTINNSQAVGSSAATVPVTGSVNFNIDMFNNVNNLNDLVIRVYINGIRVDPKFWNVVSGNAFKQIVLNAPFATTDILTIRAFAAQSINSKGYYEVPVNVQSNPLNETMGSFSLGEVIDHVNSIIDNIPKSVLDSSHINISDLGNITQYGTKFVQHSGPGSLSIYHMASDSNNIITSIEQARTDYNNFKRNFVKTAGSLGVDGDPVILVDLILQKLNKDKPKTAPYYFSDMVPYGAAITTKLSVVDYRIKTYPLSVAFTLSTLSYKAVGIYLNGTQLIYGQDYTFNSQGFVVITDSVAMATGDTITTIEYDSTDGCFVPMTPTKMGLYPAFVPQIYTDTSLITPRRMIQGHDGSQVLAYGDYRDNLILELEKRIFNNIKVAYDTTIFDIADFVPSYNRSTDYGRKEFNRIMSSNFYKWTALVGQDFTKPLSYDINNPFTYNYSRTSLPNKTSAPGYWRGVYNYVLDTDRPNICPWEMLGFSIMPSWWTSVYGPAPYTSDNLPMWQDINDGMVRKPGQPAVYLSKYAKPFLMQHIPVDESGNVASPLVSGLASGSITTGIENNFVFGDGSPVESAWKRSSHYPFSILITCLLLQPAKTLGIALDRSRIIRNLAGQLVYTDTGLRISPATVIVPSTYSSKTRIQTAGVVNYIVDHILNFIFSNNIALYNSYKNDLATMTAHLSYRLGAFSGKEQFNLLLDSKTPLSTGSVFIPAEDYSLILNKSSPIRRITYSGVIITKMQSGYEIKGYSRTQPFFAFYQYVQSGATVNIGGISQNYSMWAINEEYSIGSTVQYNNIFYSVIQTHVSANAFNSSYFTALGSLPMSGGVSAIFRKTWNRKNPVIVPYGTQLATVQQVVDFLTGYGEWLKDQGFIFDEFNSNINSVTNWETSSKEFMFWSTQSWAINQSDWADWIPDQPVAYGSIVRYTGDYYAALYTLAPSSIFDSTKYNKLDGLNNVGNSVISLSPSANGVKFSTNLAVVDSIKNPYYEYEIVKVDGTALSPKFLDSVRNGNTVSYVPRTVDGIYGATFYLVQHEQIILLNNKTIFNDVIYNPASGYRQEKIKVSGHVSTNWQGGLDIPGFIFDQAVIQQWQPWQDYALGDIVNYQGYYYSAIFAIPGTIEFVSADWSQLSLQPTPKLIPNWTYKATQFTDFYNLDSENFDSAQQTVAQHLIGYQKRPYLSNIIQDSVSEFKFYQGMIREKGTQNVLNKLFNVLSSKNKESLTFYEEWAIRMSQYGASRAFENIEFVLDDVLFRSNPQGFQLNNQADPTLQGSFIIEQTPNDVYLAPLGYNSSPWPVLSNYSSYLRSAGYVNTSDVFLTLASLADITAQDITKFSNGAYVWVTFDSPHHQFWNIYRYTNLQLLVTGVSLDNGVLTITLENLAPLTTGQYVGLSYVASIKGFYQVTSVSENTFTVNTTASSIPSPFTKSNELVIYGLISQRSASIDLIDSALPTDLKPGELLWTDNGGNGMWATWAHTPVYNLSQLNISYPQNQLEFGVSLAVNNNGSVAAIGTSFGEIIIYDKVGKAVGWTGRQIIQPPYITPNVLTTTLVSTTLNSITVLWTSVTAAMLNAAIQGQGIPTNAFITTVNAGTSFTISQPATATNASATVTITENLNPPNTIGSKMSISPDGTWMIAGSPFAGYATTNYIGAWDSTKVYAPGVIVSVTANRPTITGSPVSTKFYYQALRSNSNTTPATVSSIPGGLQSVVAQHTSDWTPQYYIPVDSYGTWSEFVTYPANSLVTYKSNLYSVTSQKIYGQISLTVTGTIENYISGGISYSNVLTTSSTLDLAVGTTYPYEISFDGNVFGGITAETIYYLSAVIDSTHFTVSTVYGGPSTIVSTAFGIMTATQLHQPAPDSENGQWTFVQAQAGIEAQGVISLYKKDSNDIYSLVDTIVSPAASANENFGSSFGFSSNVLYVGASGYLNNTGRVYKLKYSTITQASSSFNPVGSSFSTIAVTSTTGIRTGMTVIGTGFTGGQTVVSVISATKLLLSGTPNSTPSGVLSFAITGWSYDTTELYVGQTAGENFGNNIEISNDASTLVISSSQGIANGAVHVYTNTSGNFAPLQTISGTSLTFGKSITVSDSGTYIAISDDTASTGQIYQQGAVTVYEIVNGLYAEKQSLVLHQPEVNGHFGNNISFMNDYATLVVYSQYGSSYTNTTFDSFSKELATSQSLYNNPYVNDSAAMASTATTFDQGSTNFNPQQTNSGRVDVYDRYNINWVFSESLADPDPSGSGYGVGFAVGKNCVLVGAPYAYDNTVQSGKVYDYVKDTGMYTWQISSQDVAKPDTAKIKKAFLYNKTLGRLVRYLDVIDPSQGKIPGPAEAELTYKAFYDPATYSIGNSTVNVDANSNWTDGNVGRLWWDLRTTKFLNGYENNPVYKNTSWNTLAHGASVDIYEWVSTTYLPADWDSLADTATGLALGISGRSLYGNTVYSIKQTYNTTIQALVNTYYYWVKNKAITPSITGRNLSASSVSKLIGNPRGYGYSYMAITGLNSFSLVNIKQYLTSTDIVLSVEYWLTDKIHQNIHSHWKIISEDPTTYIPAVMEEKWIDSLCGHDAAGRVVPDPALPPKLRYGVENRPRQAMFVNRFEALKEFVEAVNLILIQNQIVENSNLDNINTYEKYPQAVTANGVTDIPSGAYDVTYDTYNELSYASVTKFVYPSISPVITNGKITGIIINTDSSGNILSGYGYAIAPLVTVKGSGTGAVIRTRINASGQIIGATVISAGEGYDSATTMSVRNFSALIKNDVNSNDRWSIYTWTPPVTKSLGVIVPGYWTLSRTQSYDVRKFWNYADWYATGFNQFTAADFSVSTFADLNAIDPLFGEIVKIRNTNTGGWLLLEKYASSVSVDWTKSYSVIGIQNGTIQLSNSLYQSTNTEDGYDNSIYDTDGFDLFALTELRIILTSLKNDIFINTLAGSYLDLFFNSVRYAHSEQPYIDWIFKTSFVKAKHRIGYLDQPVTYRPNNLRNFEDYVAEVKPYKTKVRQYIDNYENIDNAKMPITDFDLQPIFENNQIKTMGAFVSNGKIVAGDPSIESYPWKFWLDNVGFELTDITITSSGSGYSLAPQVKIVSQSGSGAIARAFIANGTVNRIVLLSVGSGYLEAPVITLDGGLGVGGVAASAVAIIGNSVVRTTRIGMKFDRIEQTYYNTQLQKVQTFTGNNALKNFVLTWGPDIRIGQSTVKINGVVALRDSYTLTVISSKSSGHTTYSGLISFDKAPAKNTVIVVSYNIDIALLSATDRIQYYYNPATGQLGKDLAQLMTGVDYGGVVVNGLGFSVANGWDSLPYYSDTWDEFDSAYTDAIFQTTANQHTFTLSYVPLSGTQLTIYKVASPNPIRLDDVNYDIGPFTTQVINALAYDALFVSNYQSIQAGLSILDYVTANSLNPTEAVLSISNLVSAIVTMPGVAANSALIASINTNAAVIVSIIDGGLVPPILFPAPASLTAGYTSAVALLNDNITFFQAEITAYITATYPGISFNTAIYQRNVQYAIWSLIYDLLYGGNSQTSYDALRYWLYNSVSDIEPANYWRDVYNYLGTLAKAVILNGTIIPLQATYTQYKNVALTGGSVATSSITANIAAFVDIVSSTIKPTPAIVLPTITNGILSLRSVVTTLLADAPTIAASFAVSSTAIVNTYLANGTTNTFSIPVTYTVNNGDRFILRQITSDGSIAPQDRDYDTSLSGGTTDQLTGAYTTATGLSADDIIVDGDSFVTPDTSYAPEEVVPGQVIDAVAIKVFDKSYNGSANIVVKNYVADGSATIYAIGQIPNSSGAVIVKSGQIIKTLNVDYTVDYRNSNIVFNSAPTSGTAISVFSLGFNGYNILDIDYFIGDGATTEFVTKAAWLSSITSLVYVDGVVVNPQLFETDTTYASSKVVGLRFAQAPAAGELINYVIVAGSQQTFSITQVETVATTSGVYTYTLKNPVGNSLPNESSMIVRVNNTILPAPKTNYFKIGSNRLNYSLDSVEFAPYSIPITDIKVYFGTTQLAKGSDYTVDLSGITIKINRSVYNLYAGHTMVVSVTVGESYMYNASTNQITFSSSYANTNLVQVISSYAHDILSIERTASNISSIASLEPSNTQYFYYQALSGNIVQLNGAVINENYVWIIKNGILLSPTIDYKLNDDRQSITLGTALLLTDNIETLTFNSNVIIQNIAYMQFKDMLNRVTYKRLNLNKLTKLAQPLNWNDLEIVVDNASNFDAPNTAINKPGIIEIRGERIEFFAINGNVLSKLRRGTLGTGVNHYVKTGFFVQEIGSSETIPYTDTQITETVVSNGTGIVNLKFAPKLYPITDPTTGTVRYVPADVEVFVGGYTSAVLWLPGVTYAAGTIVMVGGYNYRCTLAHTSEATFAADSANWAFFVGNIRLKKEAYAVHNVNIAPGSPAGDVNLSADFTIDNASKSIVLTNLLTTGTQVTVIKNTGVAWDGNKLGTAVDPVHAPSVNVMNDSSNIANFIKAAPGTWYFEY